MATRKILTTIKDEEFLRKKSRQVEVFDAKLWQLIDDMVATMKQADGVGLAAPQIGILKRVAVVCVDADGKEIYELVNPVIIEQNGEQKDEEGCLSVPKLRGEVRRPALITVEFFDRKGNKKTLIAKELLTRAICHEVDHLNGVLFIDKVTGNRE